MEELLPYTLDDLVQDIKEIIKTEKMPDGSEKICYFVIYVKVFYIIIIPTLPYLPLKMGYI